MPRPRRPLLPALPVQVRFTTSPVSWVCPHPFEKPLEIVRYRYDNPKQSEVLDAWEVRESFFSIPSDPLALKLFLEWTGKFSPRPFQGQDIRLSDIWGWRELLQQALARPDCQKLEAKFDTRKVRRLASYDFSLSVSLREKAPSAVIWTDTTLDAMISTVQVDILQGAKFRWCARPDCKVKIFRVTSAHERKYCSYDCAHLQSIRKKRGTVVKVEQDTL
jgi:hypothetical protein